MSANGRFRSKPNNFTQVCNHAITDIKLSTRALGLYVKIQHFITIPGFTLYKAHLKRQCKEGEKPFEAMWKELKDKGYLEQFKMRDSKGVIYWEYDLLDIPNVKEPLINKESVHTPLIGGVDDIHTPQIQGMDNPGDGKGGVYNNTNLNHTNQPNIDNVDKSDLSDLETPSPQKNLIEEEEEPTESTKLSTDFERLKELYKDEISKRFSKTIENGLKVLSESYDYDFLEKVFQYAVMKGSPNLKYICTIIDDKTSNGITTADQFTESLENYSKMQKKARENHNAKVKNLAEHKPGESSKRQYAKGELERMVFGRGQNNVSSKREYDVPELEKLLLGRNQAIR